jgi:hypothetical protein
MSRRRPELLPFERPRLDGRTWLDRRAVGRMSFEVSTLYEMGYREAFEPEAHLIADQLMDRLLPAVPLGDVADADAPYLRRVFMVASQIGAGIGIVEARTLTPDEWCSDRRIWGALWKALDDLPRMHRQQQSVACFMLHSGYYVARSGNGAIDQLLVTLRADLDRAAPDGSS